MESIKSDKKYAYIAIIVCILLIFFSGECMNAALSGFNMWLLFVMPSIFPFFVCMALLRESGIFDLKGKNGILALFFSCSLAAAPSGSRICNELYETGQLDKKYLSQFSAFCNMASPAFLTGTIAKLAGKQYVLPVVIGHYAATIIMLLLNIKKLQIKQLSAVPRKKATFFEMICKAIEEATFTTIKICGVIIFFTVILALIIKLSQLIGINTNSPVFAIIISSVEMTNGCSLISALSVGYSVKCALLCAVISFGGLCIMAQSGTFCDIKSKKYLQYKLITACIAGMISFIVSLLIPQSSAVFSDYSQAVDDFITGSVSLGIALLASAIACAFVWLAAVSQARHR